MESTRKLLAKALKTRTCAEWARMFNITPQTFYVAKRVGRLSPALAGNIAMEIGEDHEHWMAVAVLENDRDDALLARLRERSKS